MKFSYPLLKKLFPRVPPKAALAELLNMYVFEMESVEGNTLDIKLPANRWSDAASHIGIAREIAAVKGARFTPAFKSIKPSLSASAKRAMHPLRVRVEDRKACPRYAARVFQIGVVRESPKEMQAILKECGLKPINNIVDIMNYVMLETGQPLHAFDFEKLAERTLVARRARKGETIETLDGQRFALDPEVLVIADAKHPQAIAGVKGGMASGISSSTRHIVVEAANFEQGLILRTSRRLKLATDASARFGHGMSPALVDQGIARATELLLASGAKFVHEAEVLSTKIADRMMVFDCSRYESLIGAPIDPKTAKTYFERLGFTVNPGKANGKRFMVRIPPWRTDIENEEGLIEEVVRLYGLNKVSPRPPVVSILPPHEEDAVVFKEKVRTILAKFGVSEVYNASFIEPWEAPDKRAALVEVANPIAEDKKHLRNSLLPSLVINVGANARFFESVRIFEIGNIFMNVRGNVVERPMLGVVLAAKKDPKVILELKGLAKAMLEGLGIGDGALVEHGEAISIESDGEELGTIVYREIEKQWSVALAEIDLQKMLAATEEEQEYIPLRRFPAVMRDISVLLDRSVRIGSVMGAIQGSGNQLIENVDLVDEYRDAKLGDKQSLTFRIIFQADDRTLTDAEVNGEMEKITEILKKEFRAEVR